MFSSFLNMFLDMRDVGKWCREDRKSLRFLSGGWGVCVLALVVGVCWSTYLKSQMPCGIERNRRNCLSKHTT